MSKFLSKAIITESSLKKLDWKQDTGATRTVIKNKGSGREKDFNTLTFAKKIRLYNRTQ